MADAVGLFQWLEKYRVRTEKLEDGSEKAEVPTHYSLVGGKFNIPREKHQEWLRLYAAHLQRGREPVFFIELRTPIFRMHFDVDLIQPTVPTLSDIVSMAQISTQAMRRFYPDTSAPHYSKRFITLILKSPTMSKGPWEGDGTVVEVKKTGFHIIWPFLLVNQDQALTLRESCVIDMVQQLPPRQPPSNSYEDVIDECVLTDNGLRMVGSDKAKTCPICKGKRECDLCRRGKVPEHRVYEPFCILNEHGELDEAMFARLSQPEDKLPCVRLCSIRAFAAEPTPGYVKPPLAPTKDVESVTRAKRRLAVQKAKVEKGKLSYEEGVKWLSDASEIPREAAVFAQVQEFLQQRMGHAEWGNVLIKRFMFSPAAGKYFVKVWGEGSLWCSNVRRMHYSSTIYFVISRTGVVQKCFCKKKNPDAPVFCSSYSSPPIKLTKLLSNVLFETDEEEAAAAPPLLVQPVASIKPFVPSEQLVQRVKTKYIDLTPCLQQLATVSPDLVAKQQLAAQQAAQRLAFAIQQRERGKVKASAAAGSGSKSGTTKSAPAGSGKTVDIVESDARRATQQVALVDTMRQELQQRGITPPPLKKARKASGPKT